MTKAETDRSHAPHCDECGWVGKRTTSAMASYALRRHSCDRQRRRDAARERGEAFRSSIDRNPKPCAHPYTIHVHGTHACYVLDRCRCLPCANANADYERARSRRHAYGRWDHIVDAQPAREHVRFLMANGLGLKRIVVLSGVSSGSIWKLVYGKRGADGAQIPSSTIRRDTADKLLAVQPTFDALAGGASVDPIGTRRRIQALVANGWSLSKLAVMIGWDTGNLSAMLKRDGVSATTARKVAALYEELHNTLPPNSTHRDKISVSRSINFAKRNGWLPPIWWDEDTIDNPDESTVVEEPGIEDLDEIAVERIMAGTLEVALHGRSAELLEAIRRLARLGCNDTEIGQRVGRSKTAVTAQRIRNNIPAGVRSSRATETAIAAIADSSGTSEDGNAETLRRSPAA